jgi:hypothetical protein
MSHIIEGARAIKKVIQRAIEDNDGALIGRNGSTELELMIDSTKEYLYQPLTNNAGIFPLKTIQHILNWQSRSIYSSRDSDILATGWYKPLVDSEQIALKKWNFQGVQIPLRSLEPYYTNRDDQWTHLLSGHRVAVVSSFTQTMKSQSKHLEQIWGSHGVLPPNVNWSWIQTGYSPSVANGINEWPSTIQSWTDAVEYVVSEVIYNDVRFALIGCGGLSMPIAKALKDRGIIAIVLGGAIQVLFGIKGRRWVNHEIISKFWNDAWVYPSDEETPRNARVVEGGCYWQ